MEIECEHTETEKQFIDYHFTEELFATFCKQCDKQLTETKTE